MGLHMELFMDSKDIKRLQKYLNAWYLKNKRELPWRKIRQAYPIWISEVMLQQTQVNTVLPYYRKFIHRFPDLKHLARADLQDVLKIWEGLGYYARAHNLHRAAVVVLNQYKGILPDRWEDLRKLPGVGDYIAAAVLSVAFGQAYPVVDGNVKRVLARLLMLEAPVNASASTRLFKEAAGRLLDLKRPGIFNQAIMELGATVCKPGNPACGLCPLQGLCRALRFKKVDQYPQKLKRRAIPEYPVVAAVVAKNGKVLITRRKPEGLLGGLWEFPGGKIRKGETAEAACIREIKEEVNLNVNIDTFLIRIKHAYTHFKIIMDVFCCRYVTGRVRLNGPTAYRWINPAEIDQYAFPKANHKFIGKLKQHLK
jgi:A/G-specific adenine glycosylase